MSLSLHHPRKLVFLVAAGLFTLGNVSSTMAGELPLSEPLDQPVMIHERLISNESAEVPPEPVPPPTYQALDALTPALVAEEILRLRDLLGEIPISGRPGFQLMPLENENGNSKLFQEARDFVYPGEFEEQRPATAPWQREEDRNLLRERLRSMASRPLLSRPRLVPEQEHSHADVEQPVPPAATTYAPTPTFGVPHSQPHFQWNPYVVGPPQEFVPVTPLAEPQQAEIDVLRQTAHQLEESAHQLECQDQFERADQVRELANQLRLDARRVKHQVGRTASRIVRPASQALEASFNEACPETSDCPGAPLVAPISGYVPK